MYLLPGRRKQAWQRPPGWVTSQMHLSLEWKKRTRRLPVEREELAVPPRRLAPTQNVCPGQEPAPAGGPEQVGEGCREQSRWQAAEGQNADHAPGAGESVHRRALCQSVKRTASPPGYRYLLTDQGYRRRLPAPGNWRALLAAPAIALAERSAQSPYPRAGRFPADIYSLG